ncbi:MAG: hypothetical protein AAF901_14280, partial [Bacteroidota bacterium]
MKNLYLVVLFSVYTASSQVNYELGYIIDNSGNRIECFIKNLGWYNNPSEISYKLDLGSSSIQ